MESFVISEGFAPPGGLSNFLLARESDGTSNKRWTAQAPKPNLNCLLNLLSSSETGSEMGLKMDRTFIMSLQKGIEMGGSLFFRHRPSIRTIPEAHGRHISWTTAGAPGTAPTAPTAPMPAAAPNQSQARVSAAGGMGKTYIYYISSK